MAGNSVMLKRRPCRLQIADCRLCRPCRTVQTVQTECYFFFLYLTFLVKFYYSFLLPLIMCTVHHHHMCTDVYLQGSRVGNEKITRSSLPADVKAVFACFQLCRFHAGASTMEDGKLFLSVTVLYCHDYLFFQQKKLFQVK